MMLVKKIKQDKKLALGAKKTKKFKKDSAKIDKKFSKLIHGFINWLVTEGYVKTI